MDVTIELRDWLFALEGAQDMAKRWWFSTYDANREERCWHTTFHTLRVNAKSCPKKAPERKAQSQRIQQYPVELVTVKTCILLSSKLIQCVSVKCMCKVLFTYMHDFITLSCWAATFHIL